MYTDYCPMSMAVQPLVNPPYCLPIQSIYQQSMRILWGEEDIIFIHKFAHFIKEV